MKTEDALRIKRGFIRLIQDIHLDLSVCPDCKNKTMRITPKKKIKFCFYCGEDIK